MDLDVLATVFPNSTFSTTVRDLCVMLDDELAFCQHYQLCRDCCDHLHQLSVCRSLTPNYYYYPNPLLSFPEFTT